MATNQQGVDNVRGDIHTDEAHEDGSWLGLSQCLTPPVADLYRKFVEKYAAKQTKRRTRVTPDVNGIKCHIGIKQGGCFDDFKHLQAIAVLELAQKLQKQLNGQSFSIKSYLLDHLPKTLDVHKDFEAYTVPPKDPRKDLVGQLGVRLKQKAKPFPAGHLVGPYQGKQYFEHDFKVKKKKAKMMDAVLAANIERYAHNPTWNPMVGCTTYNVPPPYAKLTAMAILESAYGVGNLTSLINDPTIAPLDVHAPADEVVGPANIALVELHVGPWVFPFMCALRTIQPGEDLKYLYGEGYWDLYAEEKDNIEVEVYRKQAHSAEMATNQHNTSVAAPPPDANSGDAVATAIPLQKQTSEEEHQAKDPSPRRRKYSRKVTDPYKRVPLREETPTDSDTRNGEDDDEEDGDSDEGDDDENGDQQEEAVSCEAGSEEEEEEEEEVSADGEVVFAPEDLDSDPEQRENDGDDDAMEQDKEKEEEEAAPMDVAVEEEKADAVLPRQASSPFPHPKTAAAAAKPSPLAVKQEKKVKPASKPPPAAATLDNHDSTTPTDLENQQQQQQQPQSPNQHNNDVGDVEDDNDEGPLKLTLPAWMTDEVWDYPYKPGNSPSNSGGDFVDLSTDPMSLAQLENELAEGNITDDFMVAICFSQLTEAQLESDHPAATTGQCYVSGLLQAKKEVLEAATKLTEEERAVWLAAKQQQQPEVAQAQSKQQQVVQKDKPAVENQRAQVEADKDDSKEEEEEKPKTLLTPSGVHWRPPPSRINKQCARCGGYQNNPAPPPKPAPKRQAQTAAAPQIRNNNTSNGNEERAVKRLKAEVQPPPEVENKKKSNGGDFIDLTMDD